MVAAPTAVGGGGEAPVTLGMRDPGDHPSRNNWGPLIVPRDIAIICGSALLICLLGGLIPAWRAGRLKPVEALRYE